MLDERSGAMGCKSSASDGGMSPLLSAFKEPSRPPYEDFGSSPDTGNVRASWEVNHI